MYPVLSIFLVVFLFPLVLLLLSFFPSLGATMRRRSKELKRKVPWGLPRFGAVQHLKLPSATICANTPRSFQNGWGSSTTARCHRRETAVSTSTAPDKERRKSGASSRPMCLLGHLQKWHHPPKNMNELLDQIWSSSMS